MNKTLFWIVVVLIIGAFAWLLMNHRPAQSPSSSAQPIAVVHYQCLGGKTIDASYYKGATPPAPSAPSEPPQPSGTVSVVLSDGRTLSLSQTISADGIRYANGDESIVFWSKGNGAFLMENNQETFGNCVVVPPQSGDLSQVYVDPTNGFSLRYPSGWSVDSSYTYQEIGPGKSIGGVKFTIDPSIASGTNLGSDTYLSVEQIQQTTACSASNFLDQASTAMSVDDNGTTYSVASSTGAGAGNRYEETVYALPGTNPCTAVRYFIHYSVLENYPSGTVQQFDEQSLLSEFDAIRRSLTLVH